MCDGLKAEQPFLCRASVVSCKEVSVRVFCITVTVPLQSVLPQPGQFFMLRSVPSAQLLARPISVYHVDVSSRLISFLVLQKGRGTAELCSVRHDDFVDILGPQGNSFSSFTGDVLSLADSGNSESFCAIIGAGIGVAPVAGFASSLTPASYDFYASFRSGVYGLEFVNASSVVVTTEDGSAGVKGMLPAVFSADVCRQKKYRSVYACGPEPMLAYVQSVCREAGVPCFLSMEARMACGMGACLGCTISTTKGNRRCCVDGPVFPGDMLIFKSAPARPVQNPAVESVPDITVPDMSVTIAGVRFKNPVIAASGTFGYGTEYEPLFDVAQLGGICSKGLTFDPKSGNSGIRLHESPSGLINSIGLENPGIVHFIDNELPRMMKTGSVVIANLSGSSIETYTKGAAALDKTDVPMIELNISCPNVKAGGMAFGLEEGTAAHVVSAVRSATKKPLMVKLSPNAPHLCDVAEAVVRAGADAVSLVNTFQALAINIETGSPVFDNVTAGLAGPAIKPIALRMVWDVCRRIASLPENLRVPVVGLGGISSAQDAIEFLMAGAAAVQVGTATFCNPRAMIDIINGIQSYMERKHVHSISDIRMICNQ